MLFCLISGCLISHNADSNSQTSLTTCTNLSTVSLSNCALYLPICGLSLRLRINSLNRMLWTFWKVCIPFLPSILCPTNALETEMLPSLDNFISYGTDVFRARSDYRQMVVDIYTTSINNNQLGENDRINGCKLVESALLNLRGSVDDVSICFGLGFLESRKCFLSFCSSESVPVLRTQLAQDPCPCVHPCFGFLSAGFESGLYSGRGSLYAAHRIRAC